MRFPRFHPENLVKNKVFFERIATLASKHGCTPGQLALAWLLHQGDVVPIPGKEIALHTVGARKLAQGALFLMEGFLVLIMMIRTP